MELRVDRARATRDVDLAAPDGRSLLALKEDEEVSVSLQREIQRQAAIDLNDHFQFVVSEPILDLEAAPYGGARFHVEARLDGRTFAKFHLDVGVGDTALKPLDVLESRDWLAFAGFPATKFPTLSKEHQFAEKIHAYALPPDGSRTNSRVKDLVDLVLLIGTGELESSRIKAALEVTFKQRGTHPIPKAFPDPPQDWGKSFRALAEEVAIEPDLENAVSVVRNFLRDHLGH